MTPRQMREHATHSGHKMRIVFGVVMAPNAIGIIPASTGKFGSAVHAVPIRRIMAGELLKAPRDAHFAKHGEVCGGIGRVGIQQGTVPIEQHTLYVSIPLAPHCFRLAEAMAVVCRKPTAKEEGLPCAYLFYS